MAHLEDYGKEKYFEENGYIWDERFEIYINKAQWKIFSKDYIDDHSFDVLITSLEEQPTPNHWKYYYNTEFESDVHATHKHFGVRAGMRIKW
ncbi:MAG: hypothetical protein PVJ39_08255 [Gammaproteobacteria bacterium]|jgi:hypothetical protein